MGPRGSWIHLVGVALMSSLMVAVAQAEAPPASEPEAYVVVTSPEQIVGTWAYFAGWMRFDEDGTFRSAWSADALESAPYAILTYRFEDGTMLVTDREIAYIPACGDVVGRYELRLLERGALQIVAIEDSCRPRLVDMVRVYERAE